MRCLEKARSLYTFTIVEASRRHKQILDNDFAAGGRLGERQMRIYQLVVAWDHLSRAIWTGQWSHPTGNFSLAASPYSGLPTIG